MCVGRYGAYMLLSVMCVVCFGCVRHLALVRVHSIALCYDDLPTISVDMNAIGDKPSSVLPFGVTMTLTSEPPAHVLHIRRQSSRMMYVIARPSVHPAFLSPVPCRVCRLLVLGDLRLPGVSLGLTWSWLCRLIGPDTAASASSKTRIELAVSMPELRVFLLDHSHQVRPVAWSARVPSLRCCHHFMWTCVCCPGGLRCNFHRRLRVSRDGHLRRRWQ
jgi:hypothetical protein